MTAKASARFHRAPPGAGVTLSSGELEATFLPGAGMLGTSLRADGEEFVALPAGVAGYRRGEMTGFPILAPWANRLGAHRYRVGRIAVDLEGLDLYVDENGLPIHGSLRSERWDLVRMEAGEDAARLTARFDYGARPDLLAAFPFPHVLEIDVEVRRRTLSVRTSLAPSGRPAVPVSFGFHPYFRLPRAPRASWRLDLPARRHLLLDPLGLPTGDEEEEPAESEPIGRRTFDDLYALGDDRRLGLSGEGGGLVVDFEEGYRFAQVYAPPRRRFVCLEPMTAPTDALRHARCPLVRPGERFTARFSVTVLAPSR